jgi:hypothetical protein
VVADASAPPGKPSSLQDRFERAARLEDSDPEGALSIYDQLSREHGEWAANALFAAARLELERKHTAAARHLLESYLARFPQGGNAEDARELLARTPPPSP